MTKITEKFMASHNPQKLEALLEESLQEEGEEEVKEVYVCPLQNPRRWSVQVFPKDLKKLHQIVRRAIRRNKRESEEMGVENFGIQISSISHTDHPPK